MGVAADEQRPRGALRRPVLDDGLGGGQDVRLVERRVQTRPPMPGGAEHHLLVDVVRVGFDAVVRRDHLGHIDEILGLSRLTGSGVGRHALESAPYRDAAYGGTAILCVVFGYDRRELAAVFVGGALGTLARAALETFAAPDPGRWPWPTFAVNIVGAFLLGYFTTRLLERLPVSSYRRPLLGTGLCGGLTTFSTMQVEILKMVEHGHYGLAIGYTAASIVAGLLALYAATALVRRVRVRAMTVAVWAGVVVMGGLGAVLRFLVDRTVSGRVSGAFPVRHVCGQHQRRPAARFPVRPGAQPAPRAADRHCVRRFLHDVLDMDAGDPATRRRTSDAARGRQHRRQPGGRPRRGRRSACGSECHL